MTGIISDNIGRSSGLVKTSAAGATVDGRWTLLDTTTFSSDASTFDYAPTFMQSGYGYKLLKVSVFGLNPATNNSEVYMRLKGAAAANGAVDGSFVTSGYYGGSWLFDDGGTAHGSRQNVAYIPIGWDNMNNVGTASNYSFYEFYIQNGGLTASTSGSTDANRKIWWFGYMSSGSDGSFQNTQGNIWNGYDCHGMQWYASSGDMGAGMICKTYYDNQLGSN